MNPTGKLQLNSILGGHDELQKQYMTFYARRKTVSKDDAFPHNSPRHSMGTRKKLFGQETKE